MSNVNELLDFLDHSHSSFHAVKNLGDILEAKGFKYLKENERKEYYNLCVAWIYAYLL